QHLEAEVRHLEWSRRRCRRSTLLDAQCVAAGRRPGQVEGGIHLTGVDEVDRGGVERGRAQGQGGGGVRRKVGAVDLDGDVAAGAADIRRNGGYRQGAGRGGGEGEARRGRVAGDAVGQNIVRPRIQDLRHVDRGAGLVGDVRRLLVTVGGGQ